MKERHPYKYLILLTAIYFCTFPIVGITVQKPIMLYSFQIPSSALVFPITFVLIDIIAEVYGYAISRQIIWCHIVLSIYYNFLLFGILSLESPPNWNLASAFQQIFNNGLKSTAFFGHLGILIGFFANTYLLTKLKILSRGKYFWLRSVASSSVGELLQLCIGLFGAGLSRVWDAQYIFKLIFVAFFIRIIFIAALSFPAAFIATFLKKSENIDPYDINITFNPFTFHTK